MVLPFCPKEEKTNSYTGNTVYLGYNDSDDILCTVYMDVVISPLPRYLPSLSNSTRRCLLYIYSFCLAVESLGELDQ